MMRLLLFIALILAGTQDDSKTIHSHYSRADFPLTADPDSDSWKTIQGVTADRGPRGDLTPNHRTDVRSRWSDRNLYLLFICSYEQLYSRPNPSTETETNRLWDWDVD
jgi:hypothetical protein